MIAEKLLICSLSYDRIFIQSLLENTSFELQCKNGRNEYKSVYVEYVLPHGFKSFHGNIEVIGSPILQIRYIPSLNI